MMILEINNSFRNKLSNSLKNGEFIFRKSAKFGKFPVYHHKITDYIKYSFETCLKKSMFMLWKINQIIRRIVWKRKLQILKILNLLVFGKKGVPKKKIIRKLPPTGTQFIRQWKGKYYTAIIVEDKSMPSGKTIECRGRFYSSMSAAAVAITKQPTNGWRFWKLRNDK